MNTGGPAFPVPAANATDGRTHDGGMTLRQWYAGMALQGFCANPELAGVGGLIQCALDHADDMILRETEMAAVVQESSTTVHSTDAANDYWAKFQDGILISFEPRNGWCATIREGSMGCGNTIAEAVENLRARWEEKNVVPDHSPDAGKMVEPAAALQAVARERERDQALGLVIALADANKELVKALEALLDCISETRGKNASDAVMNARAIIAKHKGAA